MSHHSQQDDRRSPYEAVNSLAHDSEQTAGQNFTQSQEDQIDRQDRFGRSSERFGKCEASAVNARPKCQFQAGEAENDSQ